MSGIRNPLLGKYIVNTRRTATGRLKMARKIDSQEWTNEKIYSQNDLETILKIHYDAVIQAFLDGMRYQEESERPF